MADKTIKLSRRYEAHGQTFDSVTVREPRWSDLMELGEPYEVQRAAGSNVIIENTPVVAGYVRRCVVTPGGEMLGELGIRDARAIRDAVLDFFRHGEPADAASATTQEIEPIN